MVLVRLTGLKDNGGFAPMRLGPPRKAPEEIEEPPKPITTPKPSPSFQDEPLTCCGIDGGILTKLAEKGVRTVRDWDSAPPESRGDLFGIGPAMARQVERLIGVAYEAWKAKTGS